MPRPEPARDLLAALLESLQRRTADKQQTIEDAPAAAEVGEEKPDAAT